MQPHVQRRERELDKALSKLLEEVRDGLEHGFFHLEVTCEVVSSRKRRLIIKGGKSHQFTIPEEDLGI